MSSAWPVLTEKQLFLVLQPRTRRCFHSDLDGLCIGRALSSLYRFVYGPNYQCRTLTYDEAASKVKQLLMLTGVTIKKKRSILSLPGLLRLALMLFVARAVGQRLLK